MKSLFPTSFWQKLSQILMAVVFFTGANGSFAQADVPESKNYQGIQYITGGIGSEESDAMLSWAKNGPWYWSSLKHIHKDHCGSLM